jgi:AcrR family transcriptional regulator
VNKPPGRGPAAKRATAGTAKAAVRPRPDDTTPSMGPDDWLDAAHAAVVAGGFDAVRVLSLARSLGISRGSFYWHFADHAELVAALIGRWRRRELEADRALEAAAGDDPVADLLMLLDAALARGGEDLADLRFELALRTLGRTDPAVARMLAEVDAVRLGVFAAKLRRVLGETREASDLAALLYVAVAGAHQALARPGSDAGIAAYLRELIAEHLIRRPAAAAAAPRRGAARRGRSPVS